MYFFYHSPSVRGFSFATAKATRQNASNPNASSERNPDTGRAPTAWNGVQLFCKDMCLSCRCVGWSGGVHKTDGFIGPLPGPLEEKVQWGFSTSSVMMKSTLKLAVKEKNGAGVWPGRKQWNLLHNRGFSILSTIEFFEFWKSYDLLLCTNSKWSREQKQCCARKTLKRIWQPTCAKMNIKKRKLLTDRRNSES